MTAFVLRRMLLLIPILVGVSFFVFGALYVIPGDAVDSMLAETGARAEDVIRLRREFGLDQPFIKQYATFLTRAVRGDLGRSIRMRIPVRDAILDQLPATLELTFAALAVAVTLGLGFGVVAGVRRGSWTDTLTMILSLVGVSMPIFWSGLLLIFLFSLKLGWLPAAGSEGIRALILPAFALGFSGAAIVARVTRSSLLEVLGREYVRTARAKGLAERLVILRHALRNAMISIVTIVGLQFGALLGGAVVVETVFGRKGIGFLAAEAIRSKDFPMVQGTVLVAALGFIVVNLLVDLSYMWIDPRIRYG